MNRYWTWKGLGVALLVVGLVAAAVFAGEFVNLVKNGDAETGNLNNWKGFDKVVSEGAHEGNGCFSRAGDSTVKSSEFIPIDPDKTYVLSGWMRSVGKGPSKLYFGLVPYDENKQWIERHHIEVIVGTETVLAEACGKGDMVVKIADGSKWKSIVHGRIAFEVDDSGEYADLPNRKVSSPGVTKTENKGDHWEIHLKNPCGQAYAAGVKVREHISGGTFMYHAASSKMVPAEWTLYSARLNGLSKCNEAAKKWWPGTRYVQILFLTNYQQKPEFELHVDDVSLTESNE